MSMAEKASVSSKRGLITGLNSVGHNLLVQRIVVGLLMAVFFSAALYLRIHFTSDVVFGGTWVKFTGIDGYWHGRIVDNLCRNFPYMASADPYLLYPGGAGTSIAAPFFDYLMAGVAWIVGLGSPSQHTVDVVAALFPPVMGALTIIPVYFIGKALCSRWAGLIAALLVAILPGEFLGRSILGFIDHHVAEALFSTTAAMFLLLALKGMRKERLAWSHLRHPRASALAAPLTLAVLGGVFLGLYLASWIGALLFVFIFAAFFVVQFCLDHVSGVPTDYLGLIGVATFLPALVVFVLLGQNGEVTVVLALAPLVPAALFGLSRLLAALETRPAAASAAAPRDRAAGQPAGKAAARGPGRAAAGEPVVGNGLVRMLYPAVVAVVIVAAFLLLWAVKGSLVGQMTEHFSILKWNSGTSVSEMVPYLWQRTGTGGYYTLDPFWKTYGFTMVFSAAGLCLLGYAVIVRREPEKVLMLLWSAVMLLAALAQRRFNYYLVVNIAALTGYACWWVLQLAGLKKLTAEPRPSPETRRRGDRKKARVESQRLQPAYAYVTLVAIALFSLFTLVPYDRMALPGDLGQEHWVYPIEFDQATADRDPANPVYEPPDAWCESLEWLKNNTPDPFRTADGSDYYYARYSTPLDYSAFPDAYGVMAWWDYGYWIARIGHRPPCQNPGGAIPGVAEFFIAQSEADAAKVMDQYGGRYVILDNQLMSTNAKFYGPFSVTGKDQADYYDNFLVETTNSQGAKSYTQATFFYPAYYQCISVRLYLFEGKAVTPAAGSCKVITWKPVLSEGTEFKVVTQTESFDSYAAAQAAVAARPASGHYAIVSSDPRVSCVPLEALTHFTLIRDSTETVTWSRAGDTVPQIRIFEYTK